MAMSANKASNTLSGIIASCLCSVTWLRAKISPTPLQPRRLSMVVVRFLGQPDDEDGPLTRKKEICLIGTLQSSKRMAQASSEGHCDG